MKSLSFRSIALIVAMLLLVAATSAQASWWNNTMRSLGLGWSDGYHSRNACSTCNGPCHCGPHLGGPNIGPIYTGPSGAMHPTPARSTTGQLPSQRSSPYESLRRR